MPWIWIDDYAGSNITPCTPTASTGSYHNFTTTISTIATLSITSPLYINLISQTLVIPQMGIQPAPDRAQAMFRGQEQVAARRETAMRAEIRNAHDKAQELLLHHLTEEQRESFLVAGFFMVVGQRTKKRYRISRNSFSGNIQELGQNNDTVARLCCHLGCNFPLADHLLAQKLSLEADEDAFLRLANRNEIVRR